MKHFLIYFGIYLAVLSLLSVIFCIYDKIAAKKSPKNRVPEKSLFALSALGGAPAMLLCMLLIRHKTAHKRFMIGIPLIILAHAILLLCAAVAAVHFGLV